MALPPLECTKTREVFAKIARFHMEKPDADVDSVLAGVRSHFTEDEAKLITREEIVDSILAYAQLQAKTIKETFTAAAQAVMDEATIDRKLREQIDALQKEITNLPASPTTPQEQQAHSTAIENLRQIEAALKRERAKILKEAKAASPGGNVSQVDKIVAAIDSRVRTPSKDPPKIKRLIRMLAAEFVANAGSYDQLVDLVHEAIEDVVPPNWTRRDTMDAISGYGDFKRLDKSPLMVKLRDLKGQMQQVAKLEDMIQKGMAPLKTGLERRDPSDTEREMIRMVNDAKKALQLEPTNSETQLKSVLGTLKTRLRHQIADLQKQIAAGAKTKRVKPNINKDDEARSLEAQRDQLKKLLDVATEAKANARVARIQRLIDAVTKKIAERDLSGRPKMQGPKDVLETRKDDLYATLNRMRKIDRARKAIKRMKQELKNGTVEARSRPIKKDDKELDSLSIEKAWLRVRVNRMIEAKRPKTPWERVFNAAASFRTLKASGDLPPLMRQGWIGFILHPFKGSKAFYRGVRATFDPRYAALMDIQMRRDPDFMTIDRAGTFFAPIEGGSMTQREEEMMGDLFEKIPVIGQVVKGSARGMNSFLNQLSFQIMKSTVRYLDPNLKNRDQVLKEVASRINDYRGRAEFDNTTKVGQKVERAVVAMGALFFSLRNWISRLKMATFYHVWKHGSTRARLMAVKDTAQFYGSLFLLRMLVEALGGEWEDDPDNPGMGKVRIGDRTVDFSGQIGSEIHFLNKMIFGEVKTMKGKTKPTFGFDYTSRESGFSQITKKVRSKMAPAPAFIVDLLSRGDYTGDPVWTKEEIAKHAASQFVPMTWEEIFSAFAEESVPDMLAFAGMALIGAGQQDLTEYNDIRQRQKAAQRQLNVEYPKYKRRKKFTLPAE